MLHAPVARQHGEKHRGAEDAGDEVVAVGGDVRGDAVGDPLLGTGRCQPEGEGTAVNAYRY